MNLSHLSSNTRVPRVFPALVRRRCARDFERCSLGSNETLGRRRRARSRRDLDQNRMRGFLTMSTWQRRARRGRRRVRGVCVAPLCVVYGLARLT